MFAKAVPGTLGTCKNHFSGPAMNTSFDTHAAQSRSSTPAHAVPRFDLYGPIHKALRSFMGSTLVDVGSLDVDDEPRMTATLAQLDGLLDFCLGHIRHENDFVHAAIEARRPSGSARTASDHVEHLDSIEALRAEVRALAQAAPTARQGLALRLYHHFSLFVAENLQHMHTEETVNNTELWSLYSDQELAAIHEELLANVGPDEFMRVLRWMVPAINPAERAGMMLDAKRKSPPEAFLSLVQTLRPLLDDNAWGKLTRAVGVSSQPELVHFS
jgi:hypothetical protein